MPKEFIVFTDALSRRNLIVKEIQVSSIGIEAMKNMYAANEDFKEAYEVCQTMNERYHTDFSKFILKDGLLFKDNQLCVPKGSIRENIVKEKHCGSLAGHFGIDKTLEQVRRFFYWQKMQVDIRMFLECCIICQKAKGRSSNVGLYTPLPTPTKPWDSINMDFVTGFPRSKSGFDSIFVVVDRFSKMSYFYLVKKFMMLLT